MFKVAGGIIIAVIVLGVIVPVACGTCAVGTAVVMEEQEKQEKAEARERKAAEAQSDSPTGETVAYKSTCNVRKRPRGSSRKVSKAKAGEPYAVLDTKGKWRKIKVGSVVGWAGCTSVIE